MANSGTGGNIGDTVRDARIRQKIDIAQVEADTKIRAKYLRALENDEFDLLPGPAYVKSFLRTYAEYLGLDAHRLIEEYRAYHEGRGEAEQGGGISEPRSYARAKQPRRIYRISPAVVIGGVVLGFVVVLYVIGLFSGGGGNGGNDNSAKQSNAPEGTTPMTGKPARARKQDSASAPATGNPSVARLELKPKRDVWVCLIDARGKRLVGGETLAAQSSNGPYRSKSFTATFGNGSIEVTVNGKRKRIADSPNPLGYRIAPDGLRSISDQQRPTCT